MLKGNTWNYEELEQTENLGGVDEYPQGLSYRS